MRMMKTTLNLEPGTLNPFWVVLAFLLVMACTKEKKTADADQYTCPMHPTVISDKQGACPVCGMDLVRKAREGEEVKITPDLAKALTSPDQSVLASIRTVRGVYESRPVSIAAYGTVTYDT